MDMVAEKAKHTVTRVDRHGVQLLPEPGAKPKRYGWYELCVMRRLPEGIGEAYEQLLVFGVNSITSQDESRLLFRPVKDSFLYHHIDVLLITGRYADVEHFVKLHSTESAYYEAISDSVKSAKRWCQSVGIHLPESGPRQKPGDVAVVLDS